MVEYCKPGKSPEYYKWCGCMSSCGSVEDKYWIYNKGAINGLHLIRELYDENVFHIGSRRWDLTEKYHEETKARILVPQHPYPVKKSWAEIVKTHNK